MERCPACRARLNEDSTQCRRCTMELALLRRTEQAADEQLLQAIAQLDQGEVTSALASLRHSLSLRKDPLVSQLLDFAAQQQQQQEQEQEQEQQNKGHPPPSPFKFINYIHKKLWNKRL